MVRWLLELELARESELAKEIRSLHSCNKCYKERPRPPYSSRYRYMYRHTLNAALPGQATLYSELICNLALVVFRFYSSQFAKISKATSDLVSTLANPSTQNQINSSSSFQGSGSAITFNHGSTLPSDSDMDLPPCPASTYKSTTTKSSTFI